MTSPTLLQRINTRRDMTGGPDACWPQVRGARFLAYDGTGKVSTTVRRCVWLVEHGELPALCQHLEVSCGNARCLNPKHIYYQTEEQRFWSKVDKSAGPQACWPWTGSRRKTGYGVFHFNKKSDGTAVAHRHAWLLATGSLPEDLFLCHRCDNPICVNPAHLFPGTPLDNHRDMVSKGRAPWQKAKAAALAANRADPSGSVGRP